MGAGLAELLLERDRGGGQTVPHPRRRLHSDAQPQPQESNQHAAGGLECWSETRGRSQTGPGLVSLAEAVGTSEPGAGCNEGLPKLIGGDYLSGNDTPLMTRSNRSTERPGRLAHRL